MLREAEQSGSQQQPGLAPHCLKYFDQEGDLGTEKGEGGAEARGSW